VAPAVKPRLVATSTAASVVEPLMMATRTPTKAVVKKPVKKVAKKPVAKKPARKPAKKVVRKPIKKVKVVRKPAKKVVRKPVKKAVAKKPVRKVVRKPIKRGSSTYINRGGSYTGSARADLNAAGALLSDVQQNFGGQGLPAPAIAGVAVWVYLILRYLIFYGLFAAE